MAQIVAATMRESSTEKTAADKAVTIMEKAMSAGMGTVLNHVPETTGGLG